MKSLRLVVLLLLAVLLPLRGGMAAAMVCCGDGLATAVAAHHPAPPEHSDHAAHPVQDEHGGSPDGPFCGTPADACHICATGCGLAALLTTFPAGLGAAAPTAADFPGLALPRLEFQRDGQDRPPRTP